MNTRGWVLLGGLLCAAGVAAGALGAHLLKKQLSADQLVTFEVAVRYQIFHATALVLVGLLSALAPGRAIRLAGYAMLSGILLFSGCIYAWILTGLQPLVHLVPIGGVAFIVGWIALAAAGWNLKGPPQG